MLRIFLAWLFCIGLACAQIGGPAALNAPDDGFSITMPAGVPVPTPTSVKSKYSGKVVFTKYQAMQGPRAYVVTLVPADTKDPKKYMAEAEQRLEKSKGELLGGKIQDTPFKGNPALAGRWRNESKGHVIFNQVLIVLANGKFYTVEFTTEDQTDLDKSDTQAFFQSFNVTK
ncbi:MAG TPA: hypothetical protein VGO93_07315 [Candidatus Xenobia bacterium]